MVDVDKVVEELEKINNNEWMKTHADYYASVINDALALLKEQQHKDKMFHALEDDWKRLKELLKEQEAKTGHWIDTTNTIGFPRCECSECNSEAGAIWMKYCPNCGAKMEGR